MKEMTVQATLENIPAVTAFVDTELEALNCPLKAQMQIDIAIDELFGNIAHYAYPSGTGEATMRFDFDETARTASITLIDSGIPFNPLQKDDPDVTIPADERAVGGLGIFMVKKTMDHLVYRRENGRNMLTFCKHI